MVDAQVKEAKQANDVIDARSALTAIAYRDPGFHGSEFDDSLAFASDMEGLWDVFDGEKERPETEWNKEYWDHINASLMGNFCKERIDLLKKVGKKVYPRSAKSEVRPHTPSSHQTYGTGQRTRVHRPMQGRRVGQNEMPSAAWMIGGAAVLLLGCVTVGVTKTLIATAVVAGGAVLLNNQRRR